MSVLYFFFVKKKRCKRQLPHTLLRQDDTNQSQKDHYKKPKSLC